jgi:hypothetical protein
MWRAQWLRKAEDRVNGARHYFQWNMQYADHDFTSAPGAVDARQNTDVTFSMLCTEQAP